MRRRQLFERAAALPLAGALAACAGTGPSSTRATAPAGGGRMTLSDLAGQLRGPLLRPGSTHYAGARVISNERYAGVRPQAIARAVVEDDVAACVRFAARSSLPFTVRCGGHSYAGYSTNTGLVCDVRRLDTISLAADKPTVRMPAAHKSAQRQVMVVPDVRSQLFVFASGNLEDGGSPFTTGGGAAFTSDVVYFTH